MIWASGTENPLKRPQLACCVIRLHRWGKYEVSLADYSQYCLQQELVYRLNFIPHSPVLIQGRLSFQAHEQGEPVGPGLLAAAEAADIDKLPVEEIRNPTLYSLIPSQEVSICRLRCVSTCLVTEYKRPCPCSKGLVNPCLCRERAS